MNQPNPLPVEKMIRAILAAVCKHTPNPEVEFWNDVFSVRVHGNDHGRLIGKNGSKIWAFSTLVFYAAKNNHIRASLRLLEPVDRSEPGPMLPFRPIDNWPREPFVNMIHEILSASCPGQARAFLDLDPEERSVLTVSIPKQIKPQLSEPPYTEALESIAKVAGMSAGAIVKIEILWT